MDATVFEPFEVDEETALECWQFAKACNNNYSKRGQNDKQKKIRDSFEGKIGEWIVYNRLARFFADLTRPDMQIYGRGQKGWESDLFAEDLEFAVKTCKRSSWESWIFQREDEDGFGRDEGIYGEDATDKIIVFVSVFRGQDDENGREQLTRRGYIRSITTLYEMRRLKLFGIPKLEHLRAYKDATYYGDLREEGFRTGIINPSVNELIERVQA
jgi:hypothetical protein